MTDAKEIQKISPDCIAEEASLAKYIGVPIYKVPRHQWDAMLKAKDQIQTELLPSYLDELKQARAERKSRHLILSTTKRLPKEYLDIIENANNEIDSDEEKEILTDALNSIEAALSRIAYPTDDEVPIPYNLQDESKEAASDKEDTTECSATDESKKTELQIDPYDSDEADALLLDQKALERVKELRIMVRVASESIASKRAIVLEKIRSAHALEKLRAESNSQAIICQDSVKCSTATEHSNITPTAKPKNLFSILGMMGEDTTHDLPLGRIIHEDADVNSLIPGLDEKLKKVQASFQKQKELLNHVEQILPPAVEGLRSNTTVVEEYIKKRKSEVPLDRVERALMSPDRVKRPKLQTESPNCSKHSVITPESRFLMYLQGS